MDRNFEAIVDSFLRDGFAFVPVDATIVQNALRANEMLLESIGSNERWTLTRPGENVADVGRIIKSKGEGFDEKIYFHFAPDLPRLLDNAGVTESAKQRACLANIECLLKALQAMSVKIAISLQKRELVNPDLSSRMLSTFRFPEPYNIPVLRYLNYPNTENQTGARDHFDKGLLSIHLGDDGGELYAKDSAGEWVAVSPPPGMALVFFGVKILYESSGRLQPLRHKSITTTGQTRTAMVLFAHADVGHQVVTAQDSYDEFYENNKS